MRKLIKKIYIQISRLVMPIFYDKHYLRGRWFDNSIEGWKWCWRCLIDQKIKGYNKHVPFPVNPHNVVGSIANISFDIDNIDNFWKVGSYFQSWNGKIKIGKGTYIAQNVGLITENHDISNLDQHVESKDIVIGNNCWIGMNAIILPGVHLGDNTIVGAGAVVTHSFDGGVIVGVPAKKIRD